MAEEQENDSYYETNFDVEQSVEKAPEAAMPNPCPMDVDQIGAAPQPPEDSKEGVKEQVITNSTVEIGSPTTGETTSTYTFKCIFCEQVLTPSDDPKLLECLHNACTNCIGMKLLDNPENGVEKSHVICPQCQMVCESKNIIDNQFLFEATINDENGSKSTDLKCSSCSDDAIATSWCVDCSEYICDNCVQAHQRLKITKDHTIKLKEDGINDNQSSSSLSQNLFCSVHPHEKLSLFCETCDRLTCRDCQLIEHREHKYKFTTEIASETRKSIGDMLKDVGYKRVLLVSAMKVIDDRYHLIADKKQALVKEITSLVVRLTNAINSRGKQLIANLNEVCESKQKTLHEKKVALELLSKMTDHCIEFTQHALDNGSDTALLYSKKQVTEHLRRIKCKRADIPNPEVPVRIGLAVDKVVDLCKAMSSIGQIVVDGRIYPSPSISPSPSHHQSPSPGQSRPPQQQSPVSPLHQRTSPGFPQNITNYQQTRLPPPYNQQFNGHQFHQMQHPPQQTSPQQQQQQLQSQQQQQHQQQQQQQQQHQQQQQQQQQHQGQQIIQQNNMGPPPITPLSQLSLAQQLQQGTTRLAIPRHPQQQQRPTMMPRFGTNIGQQQQQQVSSSTHPQGLMQDRSNLRCLLQPNNNAGPVYVQTGPGQYQAVQPHIAQQFQRFPNQQPQFRNAVRMLLPNQQQLQPLQQQQQLQQHPQQQQQQLQQHPQQLQQQQQQQQGKLPFQRQQQMANFQMRGGSARWHIPQASVANNGVNNRNSQQIPTVNDNFKITLKQQNLPATVTSTIPKTPSPNHVVRNDTERSLDKFCEDSVKDLMATIAKLDSNGVQVVAEGRQKTGGSPHVDSSTGDAGPSGKIKNDQMDNGKDDPNEDWCAVCMDGGELVCCDKCPKVFHQYCHIPNLSVEENDTWQCLLCTNFADFPEHLLNDRRNGELSFRERKIAERIILELYCQYDPSLHFREIIGPENTDYHEIIKNPIALDTIRHKLNWDSSDHYTSLEPLVRDVRLMFRNAYTYNSEDSQVYADAKTLEKFFDEQLEKFLPEYAYESFHDDDDVHPPKRFKRIIND